MATFGLDMRCRYLRHVEEKRDTVNHLNKYLSECGMTQDEFARLSGLSRSYVAEIASGAKRPGRNAIEKITEATRGKVPSSAWFEDRFSVGGAAI